MTGLIWKDLLVLRKTIRTYVLFLALYSLLAVFDIFPLSTVTAVTELIIMMLPLSAFSYDEYAKWDRYAAALPLGRRAVVGARAYTPNEQGDTNSLRIRFAVLHPDGTLVDYSCEGLSVEQVWDMVSETLG